MEGFNVGLKWGELLKGVAEYAVDEAKLAYHAVFDQLRHQGISDHLPEPPETE